MANLECILNQAKRLTQRERLQIIQELLLTLEPEGEVLSEAEWTAAWLPEIKSRLAAYDRRETSASDWRDVIARIRQSLNANPSV